MAALAVLTIPLYLTLLGQTSYGLIAFFLQLQTIITVLDIGVSATVSRNTTLYMAGKESRKDYLASLNSVEVIFGCIAALLLLSGISGSSWIMNSWLDIESVDPQVAIQAIVLMVIIVALRWLQTFYRAILFGAEKIEWVSWFNILFSTIRVVAVLPFLWFIQGGIVAYFLFQLFANLLELVFLFFKVARHVDYLPGERFQGIGFNTVGIALRSSAAIGATAFIWAVLTQADKFFVLGVSSLSEFAAYSIVVTAASVLVLLSAPLIYAIGPRMARLLAEQQQDSAIQLFRTGSLFVSLVLGACCAVGVLWSQELLWAWTGDPAISAQAGQFAPLYLVGSLFFALNYLSYSICFATGDFDARMKLSAVALVIYLPVLYVAGEWFSADGIIYSWLTLNILFFIVAQPHLYSKFGKRFFIKSVFADILWPIACCFVVFVMWFFIDVSGFSRIQIILFVTGMFFCSLLFGVFFSNARGIVYRFACDVFKPVKN